MNGDILVGSYIQVLLLILFIPINLFHKHDFVCLYACYVSEQPYS